MVHLKNAFIFYFSLNSIFCIAQEQGSYYAIKLNPIKSFTSEHTLSFEKRKNGFGAEIELGIIKNKHVPGSFVEGIFTRLYNYPILSHWNGYSLNFTIKKVNESGQYYGINFLYKNRYINDIWAKYTSRDMEGRLYEISRSNFSQERNIFGLAFRYGYISANNIFEPYIGGGIRLINYETKSHLSRKHEMNDTFTIKALNTTRTFYSFYPYFNFGVKISLLTLHRE